jgi:predicted dehydrogenase
MTVTEDSVAYEAPAPTRAAEPTQPLRVALFGLGRAGLRHAVVLSTIANVELVAIGDPDARARRNARGMGFTTRADARLDALLRRADPQALVLAQALEPALLEAALASSAAILVDAEPMVSEAALAPLVAAARHGRRIGCSVPLVHHPVFQHAIGLIESRVLGAVREVRAARYVSRVFSPAQQRALLERGATRGALAHAAADLMFVLVRMFGVPQEVTATFDHVYGTLEDEARGTWTLAGRGRLGFEMSWSTPGYPRPATVLEVEAEGGRLLVSEDALELELVAPRGGYPAGVTRVGRAEALTIARFEMDGGGQWLQDAAFLSWVADGAPMIETLDAWVDAARTVDALYASGTAGGRPTEPSR